MPRTELTQAQKLQGDIGLELFDEFCGKFYYRYDSTDYQLSGDDEDPSVLILTHPDGRAFSIEINVDVWEITPPAPVQEVLA